MKNKEKYSCRKLFDISKPWGYSPMAVENAIDKYNEVVIKQKNTIIKLSNENDSLKNEIGNLETELKKLQLELSFSSIPTVGSIQEKYIMENFEKNFNDESEEKKKEQKPISKTEAINQQMNIQQQTDNNQNVQNNQPKELRLQIENQNAAFDIPNSDQPKEAEKSNKSIEDEIEAMLAGVDDVYHDESQAAFDIPQQTNFDNVDNKPVREDQKQNVNNSTTNNSENEDDFMSKYKY